MESEKNKTLVTKRKLGDKIILQTKDGEVKVIIHKTADNYCILVLSLPETVRADFGGKNGYLEEVK